MKTIPHIIEVPVVALIACSLNAGAGEWLQDPYIHADVGASLLQDVKIKNTGGTEASFDPGAAMNLSVGTHLGPDLAVEVESGAIWNSADRVGVVTLDSVNSRADLYQVPLLLNAIYTLPTQCRLSPYIGAGAGGMASVLDVCTPIGVGARQRYCDTDFTFAYNAFAGLKYQVSDNAQVDVGYKFLGTLDHDWSDRGFNLKSEGIYTHAFLLSFSWNF